MSAPPNMSMGGGIMGGSVPQSPHMGGGGGGGFQFGGGQPVPAASSSSSSSSTPSKKTVLVCLFGACAALGLYSYFHKPINAYIRSKMNEAASHSAKRELDPELALPQIESDEKEEEKILEVPDVVSEAVSEAVSEVAPNANAEAEAEANAEAEAERERVEAEAKANAAAHNLRVRFLVDSPIASGPNAAERIGAQYLYDKLMQKIAKAQQ